METLDYHLRYKWTWSRYFDCQGWLGCLSLDEAQVCSYSKTFQPQKRHKGCSISQCFEKQLEHVSSSCCRSPSSKSILKLLFILSASRIFSGDSWVSLTTKFLLWSRIDALAEDLLTPAHNLLCSRKAAAVVVTAFTLTAVPIKTSAVAAAAVVAGTAADILAVAVIAGAAAALLAAADEVTAAVSAAAVISTAAAVQAAAVVEIAVLLDGDEWFLLSIQASHLLLACSLRLLLGGRVFFLPCLWEHPAAAVVAAAVDAAVVAAAVEAAPGCGLQKKVYSSSPPLVSKTSLALIPLATQ